MPESLPLFPLQAVLFPGVLLPLHVFEERYRTLVEHLLKTPEDQPRRFGVVAIKHGRDTDPDLSDALHPVGCTAELQRVENQDDGSFEIVTVGVRRFRLRGVDAGTEPYLIGEIDWLPAASQTGPETGLLAQRARALFEGYVAAVAATSGAEVVTVDLPDEPDLLSYLIASTALLTLEDKQSLLEQDGTEDRLRDEIRLLRRETALVKELSVVPAPLSDLLPAPGEN